MLIPNIVKGLIPQLTAQVRSTGFVLFPAFRTSPTSILTMMGYIMKKRAMAMDTTGAPPT